jgi:cellulose biosynthesis protein BcsE
VHKFNVEGLSLAAQELKVSGCYAIIAPLENLVIDFALHAIEPADDKRNIFIASVNVESFFESDFSASLIQANDAAILHAFSFSTILTAQNIERVSVGIIKELQAYKQIKNSLVFIHFNSQQLQTVTAQEFSKVMGYLNRFSREAGAAVILLLSGPDAVKYRTNIKQLNKLFNGSAYLSIEASVCIIEYDFWSHSQGVLSQVRYELSSDKNQLQAVQSNSLNAEQGNHFIDEDNVWLVHNSVPYGTKLPALYKTVKNNEELLELGETLSAATLIFSVTRDTDLSLLAKQCFELRQKSGRWLKLVIQNVDGIIRHQDECLFLTLGVNLILYSFSEPSRLLSQIQSIQGFQFSRALPFSVDDVLKYADSTFTKGYLPFNAFTKQVEEHSKSAIHLGVSGVLVVLDLLPRIDPIHPLHLFHIKREGDILTAAGNNVYLYLHACREHDVSKAINHLFKLDMNDFFAHISIISEHFYIQQECIQQRRRYAEQSVPDYTQQLNEHHRVLTEFESESSKGAVPEFISYTRPAATKIKVNARGESNEY